MRNAGLALLLLSAGPAFAHHAEGPAGWLAAIGDHLMAEPDHLLVVLVPLAIGIAWFVRRRKRLSIRGQTPN